MTFTKDEEIIIRNAMFDALARVDDELVSASYDCIDVDEPKRFEGMLQQRRDIAHVIRKLGGVVADVRTVVDIPNESTNGIDSPPVGTDWRGLSRRIPRG